MMPIDTTGLLCGRGPVEPGHDEATGRHRRLVADPPLLEVDRVLAALAVVDDDVRLDRHVGHREQVDALVRQAPAGREPGSDVAQGGALPEPLRPHDVGADVEVAEREPLGECAVRRELALHAVALVGAAPPLSLVHAVAQGVEVGAHAQAEQGDVVTGVRDDGDRRVGEPGGGVEVVAQAADEACSADAAREGRDVHVRESVSRVRDAASPPETPGGAGKKSTNNTIRLDVRCMTRV